MRAYIIRRLLLMIPTLLLVTVVVFLMVRLIPGDVIDLMVSDRIFSGTEREALEHELGLDVPVLEQYGRWIGVVPQADGSFSGILQGDLGDSLTSRAPVLDEIAARAPVSIQLGLFALLMVIIISLPIGIYSAIRQDAAGDYVGRSFATILIALPGFWVGLVIILAASIWFGISPPLSAISFIEDPVGNLGQFIPPAFVLGMASMGTTMRMTRSMMLEVLRQDYTRTAWAKGLRERVVIMRHALKNALIPVVTLLGLMMPILIGGSVIIETVFSLPGVGLLLVENILERDYPVVSGVVFFYAILLIGINIIIDLTYGYLDPRVHYK